MFAINHEVPILSLHRAHSHSACSLLLFSGPPGILSTYLHEASLLRMLSSTEAADASNRTAFFLMARCWPARN